MPRRGGGPSGKEPGCGGGATGRGGGGPFGPPRGCGMRPILPEGASGAGHTTPESDGEAAGAGRTTTESEGGAAGAGRTTAGAGGGGRPELR